MFKRKRINIFLLISLFLIILTRQIFSQNQSISETYENYEIVGEQIVIIENSGTNYISFVTIRTPFDNTGWSLEKNIKLDEFLDNFLYLNPIKYNWDDKSSPLYNYFTFSKGSYGTIIKGSFENGISIKNNETFSIKDGIYSYKNEDGVKELNGNYGFSYEQYGFSHLTYAWILPQDWEFFNYKSENNGKWYLRNNTLIFIGKNVNNLVFNIEYKRKNSGSLKKVIKELELDKNNDIQAREIDHGLQIIFGEKIFFSPGKVDLTPTGKTTLDKVVTLMYKNPNFNLQIHGHTDNVKFKGNQGKISNNWELSVFRSLSILNYFTQEKSLPGKRFEVRGYGEYRPIVPNDSPAGRAKNRRIELFLKDTK